MFKFLDKRFIDNWRSNALKMYSIRVALFWGAISGLLTVWPAFASIIPLWVFAGASVLMCMALAYARFTKQPGIGDGS